MSLNIYHLFISSQKKKNKVNTAPYMIQSLCAFSNSLYLFVFFSFTFLLKDFNILNYFSMTVYIFLLHLLNLCIFLKILQLVWNFFSQQVLLLLSICSFLWWYEKNLNLLCQLPASLSLVAKQRQLALIFRQVLYKKPIWETLVTRKLYLTLCSKPFFKIFLVLCGCRCQKLDAVCRQNLCPTRQVQVNQTEMYY